MKLTFVLFRRNRLPNGHLFRGKDRLVQKVEPKHLRAIKRDFAIEEQNMFYLRFPYLSEAESYGHTKELGRPEARKEALLDKSRRLFKKDVTLYERLQHLRVKESWDD
ncbi:uncharacterized protein LOC113503055 [Trichoplusia ni]|uniref:Uncharacterized protein LOC113503055 n=1 Tax=Trichoplusia ni TaxID=7111 RepID=A0A7E5WIW9_TRINI|nr:uncharacterized protein LOC113503055 [Trichoplusia ni]